MALYYENKNQREYISMCPTSAHSGDGMGNLVALICELSQTFLAERVAYIDDLQATVMEVSSSSIYQGSHRNWRTWKMKMVREHEKLAKSHGILCSVMEIYQFCPQIVPNVYFFGHHQEIKQTFPQNIANAKAGRNVVMENQEMVMEKSWKNIFSSLWEP